MTNENHVGDRNELVALNTALLHTVSRLDFKLKLMQKERDEARRMYCEVDNCTRGESLIIAENQGWDCYKKETP
jgi:hypothetical protein